MMGRYRLLLSYDGSAYCGWQVQNNGLSIQGLVQEHLAVLLRQNCHVTGSGRTDAGVHAKAQVAHFDGPEDLDLRRIHISLNALLPSDIRVLSIERAPEDFHARYSAKRKLYCYSLCLGKVQSPFLRRYSLHHPRKLQLDRMDEACALLLGTHDFTSFANSAHEGSAAINAVRTLYRCEIERQNDRAFIYFEGNGFLYKMVRNLVGSLLEVGLDKKTVADFKAALEAQDRKASGPTAPATGLCLERVDYP